MKKQLDVIKDFVSGACYYMVKFEKIGTISFDPFQGTSKFEDRRNKEHSLEDVIDSNEIEEDLSKMPESDFIDAVEPIKDVTQPLNQDMKLDPIDLERLVKDKVEEILKGYYTNNQ